MFEVPDVPSLRLGATREGANLLPDGCARRVVVYRGHRNSVGPDDVRSGRLENVLLVAHPASAEFDLRVEWNGEASRLELELPPLSGFGLLGFGDPDDFETLTGQEVRKRSAEQDGVNRVAEHMRCGSQGVDVAGDSGDILFEANGGLEAALKES